MDRVCCTLLITLTWSVACLGQPVCVDSRLSISLFAEAPTVVQPVSAMVDSQDRLLVIENHTHFRPDDYVGPATDRILLLEDSNNDGRADEPRVYFEGEKDSMDLVAHDGAVYLATRRKIARLKDTNGDGVADQSTTLVRLETTGDYPHNGLSGLVFDLDGMLQFGFGENLGKAYTLIGSDGTELRGEAEGGSTYRCTRDGTKLERVATGFWNPFGQCMDAFGNIFAVDNDPDATPPCRLLHVTEGANFGYQFRYGRPGTHPLQAWNGELPGTIGMVAGTGEAPCEVICCMPNRGGLPADYVGDLLVASWGDHRIERFRLKSNGGSFEASRSVIVQGDTSFWPVGIAVTADGSLYITDWGSRSYPLHGEGKIWHLKNKSTASLEAKHTAKHREDVQIAIDVRSPNFPETQLRQIANDHASPELRALAVRILASRNIDTAKFTAAAQPAAVRREALRTLKTDDVSQIRSALQSNDATLQSLAVQAIIRNRASMPSSWFAADFFSSINQTDEPLKVGVALACERLNDEQLQPLIPTLLQSTNPKLRFIAARWAADQNLEQFLPPIRWAIANPVGSFRMLLALLSAERHLVGGKFNDDAMATTIAEILLDPKQSTKTKRLAIEAAEVETISVRVIRHAMAGSDNTALTREAVYLLAGDKRQEARDCLSKILTDESQDPSLRADALVAITQDAPNLERLIVWADHAESPIRKSASRLMYGQQLTEKQRNNLGNRHNRIGQIWDRVLKPQELQNTKARSATEWLTAIKRTSGDKTRGRRLFHNNRLLQCSGCHRVGKRGADIGPELTGIGVQQSREQLINSIVHPSQRVAPQYQGWTIVDKDGRAQSGYHLASHKLVETFVDSNGRKFTIDQDDIEQRIANDQSIMPTHLIDHLTAEEVADLIAYLID